MGKEASLRHCVYDSITGATREDTTIQPKRYSIEQAQADHPIASPLSAVQVLAHFNHASLKAWMKYAQVGQWHGVVHPLLNGLIVTRIQ